jgi:hypothetical protein
MKTLSDDIYKKLFALGALWNISIGLTGVLFYDFSATLFFGADAVAHNLMSVLFFKLLMTAIIAFGIGYYIVSRDLFLNRGIVWLGLVCKMILFAVFTWLFFDGQAQVMAFLAVLGDFAWSLLFILFLIQTKERVKNNMIIG